MEDIIADTQKRIYGAVATNLADFFDDLCKWNDTASPWGLNLRGAAEAYRRKKAT